MNSLKGRTWLRWMLGAMLVVVLALQSSCGSVQTAEFVVLTIAPLVPTQDKELFFMGAMLVLEAALEVYGPDASGVVHAPAGLQPKVVGSGYASALERQADGSFTLARYHGAAPYSLIDTTPNFQSAFLNGPATGTRTFKTPPGWKFLADRLGVPTQSIVFGNLLGNGTPVGLAIVPANFNGGPNTASLAAAVPNADGSSSFHFYTTPANPVGILVADFNKDGKDDVVVIGANNICSGTCPGSSIAVYLGNGDGTLQSPVYYSGHNGTYSAVAYDFNGDNNLDLAVVNAGSGDVSILLGKGDGTFAAAVNYPAVAQGTILVAGDFNGDGRADLVVGGGSTLGLLLGKGDGTFQAVSKIPESFSIGGLAAGDFNNDGKLDLTVSDWRNGTVAVLLGDGTGKFPTEHDYAVGYGAVASNTVGNVFAMDLDGDGNLDVVVASGHPDVLTATPNLSDAIMAFFGRGDGTLIGPPAYHVGAGVNAVALADFNGDGKPDIAAASGSLWTLTSSGGGNFNTPVSVSLGTGVSASGVATADLNGDGKPDLVVGDSNGSGIYVLLGKGDGTFQAPVRYPAGGIVNSIAIADFNGDGKPDIAVCGSNYGSGSTVGILLGKGDGTFQSVTNLSGTVTPVSLTVGDFNNDGKPDLAIADQGTWNFSANALLPTGSAVVVYLGKGNGGFQSPVTYVAGIDPLFVTAADVNGDKSPDLIVGTLDPKWASNGQSDVAVLLGKGDGTFKAASYAATEEAPGAIAVADFNGDGKPDLAIAHCCTNTFLTYMLGNGDGTFQSEVPFPAAYNPSAIAVADLNGDGMPDLIVGLSQYTDSAVAVFLNVAPTVPLASIASNVSAANLTLATVSPGSIATAFGTNLATGTAAFSGSPPTTLSGTTVTIQDASGATQTAPIFYVSPTQVNYEVPDSVATGNATVTISSTGGQSASITTPVASVAPGIFALNGGGLVAAIVLSVGQNYAQTYSNVYQVDASGNVVPLPVDLSTGQVYLELYGTGVRNAKNLPVVTIGGQSVPTLSSGQQGADPGLDQINVGPLPTSLAGRGQVNIVVTVDGHTANTTNIAFK